MAGNTLHSNNATPNWDDKFGMDDIADIPLLDARSLFDVFRYNIGASGPPQACRSTWLGLGTMIQIRVRRVSIIAEIREHPVEKAIRSAKLNRGVGFRPDGFGRLMNNV